MDQRDGGTDSYRDKTVVVTGASDGIGAELALQLAAQRAKLVLAARNELRVNERATAIADLGTGVGERSVMSVVDVVFGQAGLARVQGGYQLAMELLEVVLE